MGHEVADLGNGPNRPGLGDGRKHHRQQRADHTRIIRPLGEGPPARRQPRQQCKYREIAQMQGQVFRQRHAYGEVPVGEPRALIDQDDDK